MADAFWCPFKICQPTSQIISKENQTYLKAIRPVSLCTIVIHTRMRLHNFFQSHDDFIRSLIYSNLKKSYIYFISISTSSHTCQSSYLLLVRSIVNQSPHLVVSWKNKEINLISMGERKKLWKELRSNYKADRDHLEMCGWNEIGEEFFQEWTLRIC